MSHVPAVARAGAGLEDSIHTLQLLSKRSAHVRLPVLAGHGFRPVEVEQRCTDGLHTQCGVNFFILDSRRVFAPAPWVLGPQLRAHQHLELGDTTKS